MADELGFGLAIKDKIQQTNEKVNQEISDLKKLIRPLPVLDFAKPKKSTHSSASSSQNPFKKDPSPEKDAVTDKFKKFSEKRLESEKRYTDKQRTSSTSPSPKKRAISQVKS